MIPKKNLLNRLKKTPHIRIALAAVVASILLVSGIAAVGLPKASAKSEIHATGTFLTTALLPDYNQRTSGDLTIFFRLVSTKYSGTLQGDAVSELLIVQDNVVEKVGFPRGNGVFRGTLAGSEKGTFASTSHWIADRTACPCPPGLNPIDGNFVVIEGTGTGAFEGICGGGTFHTPAAGLPATYDYTFRFGKDCKAND